MGAASIQSALDILRVSDKQLFSDSDGTWDCNTDYQMFDLIKYSIMYCKVDCNVLVGGYCVFRSLVLGHTELDVDSYITVQSLASTCMLKSCCYDHVFQISGVL